MMLGRDILRPVVVKAAALAFLANYAQFAVWLLMPFYLLRILRLSPATGGFMFVLTPLAMALAAPVGGWANDRLGARGPLLAGLTLEIAGLAAISRLGADPDLAWVALGLALVGLGVGIFQVPNLAQMMAAFSLTQQGAAGGLAFLARTLGSAAGVQVAAMLFDWRVSADGFVGAFGWCFVAATGACMLAALLELVTPSSSTARGRQGWPAAL